MKGCAYMKKLVSLVLILMLALSMSSFVAAEGEDLGIGSAKIAILTGTTSQGEEEYRAAQALAAKYPANVITATYPDNFSSEVETIIGTVMQFATDPDVKAIIFVQSVPGAAAAFQAAREVRDDLLLIAGVFGDNPDVIGAVADIVLNADDFAQGKQIIDIIQGWGVDVFVHYSFARHMSYDTIVARHKLFKQYCDEAGIQMVDRDAPDPTGEAGTTGAQQFILEDLPRAMAEFEGKKVAFFSTNCSMQEPLQKAVLGQPNAYYPMPCCPSPYHGFTGSMGIAVEENEWGDFELFLGKTAVKLAEVDALDRFSTWPLALNMGMISAAFDYSTQWIRGDFTEKLNPEAMAACLKTAASGYDAALANFVMDDGAVMDNIFLVLVDNVNYNDFVEAK